MSFVDWRCAISVVVLTTLVNWETEVGAEVNQRTMRCEICYNDLYAPSEWDGAHLDTHYRHLLSEGGHFEGNEGAYDKLLDFVKKLQFWDKTDLPSGGHIWYFHPLAFIRHFRRCPWLTLKEQARLLPSILNSPRSVECS